MGRPSGGARGIGRALLIAAALTACYEEPTTTCTIRCTPGEANSCPGDLECNAAGLCNTGGAACTGPSIAWSSIGLGARHACGLATTGDVYCWGDNSVGQLATGMAGDPIAMPTKINAGPFKALAVGAEHSCALDASGVATCWGQNAYGQSRGAGPGSSTTPVTVLGSPPPFDHITAGASHTCALAGGQLWCWGDKNFTNGTQASSATLIGGGTISDWTQIAAGYDHVCGISTANGVMCFGVNGSGQIGDNSTTTRTAPTAVQGLPAGTQPIAIAAGDELSCAIMAATGATAGQLWCWGHNSGGALVIDNNGADHHVAAQVGTDADWSTIAVGDRIACGVRNGMTKCWGSAYYGGIPNGIWLNNPIVIADAITIHATEQIALNTSARNGDHVEAGCSRMGSQVQCWGDNGYGQLALGTYSRKGTPVEVKPPMGRTWNKVDAGHHHACATTDDDALLCWGATVYGASNAGISLGADAPCVAGEVCDRALPGTMPSPLGRADEVTAGDNFSCARDGAAMHCWGVDFHGYLGGNNPTGYSTVVAPNGSTWTSLVGGDTGNCGLTAAGELGCWGYVGGTQTDAPAPLSLQNVSSIMFGDDFGCATSSSNTRTCWGGNQFGQLGSGDLNARTLSGAFTSSNVVQVASDSDHACAVTTSGGIQCWGSNDYLESGAPTRTQAETTPVTIKGTNNQAIAQCTRVSVGDSFSCAVCEGHVLCWGENFSGELGRGVPAGDPTDVADLVKLPLTETFVDVSLGHTSGCAVSMAGKLFCWGDGLHGELGDGSQGRNLPTPVAP